MHRAQPRHIADHRTCRDRTNWRNELFDNQIDHVASAYMAWSAGVALSRAAVEGSVRISVINVFSKYLWYTSSHCLETTTTDVKMQSEDISILVGLVQQGLFPCAPINPSVAITTEVLELYRVAHLCCPWMSIHAFTKMHCDLHTEVAAYHCPSPI